MGIPLSLGYKNPLLQFKIESTYIFVLKRTKDKVRSNGHNGMHIDGGVSIVGINQKVKSNNVNYLNPDRQQQLGRL